MQAAQDEVGVRSADDAGRAADIVKGIVAVLQLSQVMHQQNGDVEAVGNALDGGNVIVVVAVHSHLSSAALGVPHLLQRVNDDQLGGGMLGQEIRDLLLQPAADQPGGHGEIQVVRGAVGKIVEPVLDAALGVLKAQIEHIALQRGQTPNGISLRLVVTSSVSFVSPQAAKLTRSAAPPLPKKSKGLFGDPERPSQSINQLLPILLAPLMTLTPCEIRPSTMNIVLLIGVDSKVSASTVFSLLPIEISPL